jgi:hypothetical protein
MSASAVSYQTTEADFDDFRLDFLGEFEAIFETALAMNQGPRGDCLMKKPKVKNLVTLSL